MNTKNAGFLVVLLILSSVPIAHSQVPIEEKLVQRSVEVIIDSMGNAHVKHVVDASNSAKQMELIYGIVSNISVTNEQGERITEFSVIEDNRGIVIPSSQKNSIVEYSLDHVINEKDNIWTWDFRYLQTTNFIFPEEVDLLFANNQPVSLDDKRGIACHGCQIILEYSIDEPENLEKIHWEGKEFEIEIKSYSNIEKFNFDQQTKRITFDVSDENRFVTAVIPTELLAGPYSILLDDNEILFHEYNNNGTHIWINLKPETSGEITILDTTVIPENSGEITILDTTVIPENSGEITILDTTVIPEHLIVIILAIGFMIILAVLLIKKFSLH